MSSKSSSATVNLEKAAEVLKNGSVGVIATDTIYGIVCSAFNVKAIERLYKIRERNEHKPCIILIAESTELVKFGIVLDEKLKQALTRIWPGPVSTVLPCPDEKFSYLHRGTKSLAFRMPADEKLLSLLSSTGPLLAPSANPEGKPPAENIIQARHYFGDTVDFYIDGGEVSNRPSTLVRYENGAFITLRPGTVRVE
jgi:L-threonylcarbamoyladenylate synthase